MSNFPVTTEQICYPPPPHAPGSPSPSSSQYPGVYMNPGNSGHNGLPSSYLTMATPMELPHELHPVEQHDPPVPPNTPLSQSTNEVLPSGNQDLQTILFGTDFDATTLPPTQNTHVETQPDSSKYWHIDIDAELIQILRDLTNSDSFLPENAPLQDVTPSANLDSSLTDGSTQNTESENLVNIGPSTTETPPQQQSSDSATQTDGPETEHDPESNSPRAPTTTSPNKTKKSQRKRESSKRASPKCRQRVDDHDKLEHQEHDKQAPRSLKRKRSIGPVEENSKDFNKPPPAKRQKQTNGESNDDGGQNNCSGWYAGICLWFKLIIQKCCGYIWNSGSGSKTPTISHEARVSETADKNVEREKKCDKQEENDFEVEDMVHESGEESPSGEDGIISLDHDCDMDCDMEHKDPSNEELMAKLSDLNMKEPSKAALKLMSMLFSNHELAAHLYKRRKRLSRDKPYLSDTHREKVGQLEACLKEHYGHEMFEELESKIIESCNQKCRDIANKK